MGLKILFEVELLTEDEDEIIGIKEAMANLIEPWQDIRKPIHIEIVDAKVEQSEAEAMFNEFWAVYPRKVNKVNAFKAFKKVCKDRKMLDVLIDAVKEHKKTEQWKTTKLIPHASTWLNGQRWEDDLSNIEDIARPDTSYDLEQFKNDALHSELVYQRREKRHAVC